ncbi:MAG TPA: gamma-glutamyl-gamma-aminobutyrate hydrolase family protein [Aeromicrobium sp.]|nr:gamma-glutamyl-gamma-aminobutyrate hydrolase family protein [Aeromicrobium sp.]HKY57971.1 gamma-glutamyl-gamma-aminobutyrate hydrolase family protein [Aeromicrobium sp.]
MRPVIGLSSYRETARWGAWEQPADLLPAEYARAVEAAGGVPVLLPPSDPTVAVEVVDRLDGLVISGGADVAPQRYGEAPGEHTVSWRDDRDAWELALLDAADARELPVLGVCRGMQVMAVHAGGRLAQHVPEVVGHERHNPGGATYGATEIRLQAGSRIAALLPDGVVGTCHHHQSVAEHPGFSAVAWADDGLLEAMEAPGERFRVGIQWHPEAADDARLFAGLVEAAGRRRT